jgi:hypothetical protein
VLTIGKGLIVLDRRSPDAAGNSNLHLTLFQRQWRDEMLAIGLGPEGAAQGLVPAGGESIRAWLLP